MRTSVATSIAVVLAIMGAAGCGSSEPSGAQGAGEGTAGAQAASTSQGGGSATLEPAFVARVNHLCTQTGMAVQRVHGNFSHPGFDPLHPDPKVLPQVGAFFAASRSINDRLPDEFAALGEPRQAAAKWRAIVALARQDRGVADRQIAAAEASDVPAFVATVREVQRLSARISSLALGAGFARHSPCSEIF